MYCFLAEKRLDLAERDNAIQGYSQGVFWERNTLAEFYPREISKIGRRIEYFQKVKAFWENHPED